MKLISMVNFILQFDKPVGYLEDQSDFLHCQVDYMGKAMSYAKLLKKPLKLEMFVPCDEDGDILEEPTNYEHRLPNMMIEYNYEVYRYKQAKEKVLFENIPIAQAKWLVNTFSTIESLSDISNTITPIYLNNNAIKQIGL